MIKVSKSELKAKMLEYFRMVEETGEETIVTSHNKPAIRVVPLQKKLTVAQVFGDLRGQIHIDDTVMAPETAEWEPLL